MTEWEVLRQRIESCRLCPRLVVYRERVARDKKRAYRDAAYWGKPVPGFGDPLARLLVVGLAPGAHGSNRTGRMFTGDSSGDFLYAALHRAGFASQPVSKHQNDGLQLRDVFITSVGRCAPPENKPALNELRACRPYLLAEMALLHRVRGIVLLGRVAYEQMLDILRPQLRNVKPPSFAHGTLFMAGGDVPWLLASYHPSRQNTQTGRLTAAMFDQIWSQARALLNGDGSVLK
ncbi:MAG: uracil-DNA glycosylase [Anaerolineae bacterium]|nr:uracil-DNA glycosylase [Anaerolineae bacterium]